MKERESIEVTLEGLNDLNKLTVDVEFRNLNYDAKHKRSYAYFEIVVFAEDTDYRYGGVEVKGTPRSSGVITTALEQEVNLKRIWRRLSEIAQVELKNIKKEITELLRSAPRVTVDFNDIVDRIVIACELDQS